MTQREAKDFVAQIGPDPGKIEIEKRRVGPGKNWYRVVAGPFGSRDEAGKALETLGRKTAP
jgi:septal ring-binding cell division protein DamX